MGYKANGTVHKIGETKTLGANGFQKREIVIATADNPKYVQLVSFELAKDRVTLADDLREGDAVEIEFDVRGREWRSPSGEVRYFTTLNVWRLTKTGQSAMTTNAPATSRAAASQPGGDDSDIPF